MIGTTDWTGIAAVISATAAGLISVLTFLRTGQVHNEVKMPNGDPRTSGQVIADTAKAVGVPEPPHDSEG